MYYFWGYIKLGNKGEEGLSVAMLSTLDPKKNISLPFKKWRFSRRAFVSPHDALSWGRRLVSRYAQLKSRRTSRAVDLRRLREKLNQIGSGASR